MSQETKRRLLDLQHEYQRIKLETGYDSDDSDFENVDAVYRSDLHSYLKCSPGKTSTVGNLWVKHFQANSQGERLVGQNGD